MKDQTFLADLFSKGIILEIKGGNLSYKGPVDDSLVEELRRRKPRLLLMLQYNTLQKEFKSLEAKVELDFKQFEKLQPRWEELTQKLSVILGLIGDYSIEEANLGFGELSDER